MAHRLAACGPGPTLWVGIASESAFSLCLKFVFSYYDRSIIYIYIYIQREREGERERESEKERERERQSPYMNMSDNAAGCQ